MARTSARAKKSKQEVNKKKEEIKKLKESQNDSEGAGESTDKENDSTNYDVEKITHTRIYRGKRQYLVRWKGYSEDNDTWENESALQSCKEVLDAFKKENLGEENSEDENDEEDEKKTKDNKKGSKKTKKNSNKSEQSKHLPSDDEIETEKDALKNENLGEENSEDETDEKEVKETKDNKKGSKKLKKNSNKSEESKHLPSDDEVETEKDASEEESEEIESKGKGKKKNSGNKETKGKKRKLTKEKEQPKMKKTKTDDTDDDDESVTDGKDYEVEKILEVHTRKDGTREFLIRWKGYKPSEDTWEPEAHLDCQELIEKFMEKVDKAKEVTRKELRERKETKSFVPMSARSKNQRNSGLRPCYTESVYED